MTSYIIIQLFVHLVIGIFGWAIKYKKQYALISGFVTRPAHEQEELIANGYPQKTGALLFYTAIISGLLLPFIFIWENFMFIQLIVFVLCLLGGFFYLSKYETKKSRKKSRWFSGIILAIVGFILIGLPLIDWGGYEVSIDKEKLEITGMYGDIYSYSEIKDIQLLDQMPTVEMRTNGIGLPHLSKGHFKVKDYGSSILFIYHDTPPYIYIETIDKPIFLNSSDSTQTEEWYKQLKMNTKKE